MHEAVMLNSINDVKFSYLMFIKHEVMNIFRLHLPAGLTTLYQGYLVIAVLDTLRQSDDARMWKASNKDQVAEVLVLRGQHFMFD